MQISFVRRQTIKAVKHSRFNWKSFQHFKRTFNRSDRQLMWEKVLTWWVLEFNYNFQQGWWMSCRKCKWKIHKFLEIYNSAFPRVDFRHRQQKCEKKLNFSSFSLAVQTEMHDKWNAAIANNMVKGRAAIENGFKSSPHEQRSCSYHFGYERRPRHVSVLCEKWCWHGTGRSWDFTRRNRTHSSLSIHWADAAARAGGFPKMYCVSIPQNFLP